MMNLSFDDHTEWLETDGLGGFASGTVSGIRTRRYHALLQPATTPPTGRMTLVNGFDAWAQTASGTYALTTQRYAPDVLHPDGASRIESFVSEPWPTWTSTLPDGTTLRHELFLEHAAGTVVLIWTLTDAPSEVTLHARPFLSGRDYHSTHHENGAFRFEPQLAEAAVGFRPYDGVPGVVMLSNGHYQHAPEWYRNFLYTAEAERGPDASEDLASPGTFKWRLAAPGDCAVLILKASASANLEPQSAAEVVAQGQDLRSKELARRQTFASPVDRSADAYVVRRGPGRTIIAGYPWFTDWGRDTFIAVRGLCLATGRYGDARDILVQWAGAVSEGMLPNRFPDRGEALEFNAVDASLWYVIAAGELLAAASGRSTVLSAADRADLRQAVCQIVTGYAAGTRYGIRMDGDGLLAAGVPGLQLTWMDARVGDRVVTPRIGKPVEVQALWINALAFACEIDPSWNEPLARARASFMNRFWIEERGCLADVVDVDHTSGTRDETCRPNQILAVGGLPHVLVEGDRARQIVDTVERRLLTPMGLRSLAPGERGYAGRYEGDSSARDAVYHQGTVWPWLMGAFVDAWLRTRGNTADSREEARWRFVEPLHDHLHVSGLGHVSEIADAEAPFTSRGCPFQAWSLAELIRIEQMIAGAPRRRTHNLGRKKSRSREASPALAVESV